MGIIYTSSHPPTARAQVSQHSASTTRSNQQQQHHKPRLNASSDDPPACAACACGMPRRALRETAHTQTDRQTSQTLAATDRRRVVSVCRCVFLIVLPADADKAAWADRVRGSSAEQTAAVAKYFFNRFPDLVSTTPHILFNMLRRTIATLCHHLSLGVAAASCVERLPPRSAAGAEALRIVDAVTPCGACRVRARLRVCVCARVRASE